MFFVAVNRIFHIIQFDQFVDDRIDGQARRRMYLQFGRNIAPVRDDRMRRNKQALGDLLVGQTLHHPDDNFLFACAQQLLDRKSVV